MKRPSKSIGLIVLICSSTLMAAEPSIIQSLTGRFFNIQKDSFEYTPETGLRFKPSYHGAWKKIADGRLMHFQGRQAGASSLFVADVDALELGQKKSDARGLRKFTQFYRVQGGHFTIRSLRVAADGQVSEYFDCQEVSNAVGKSSIVCLLMNAEFCAQAAQSNMEIEKNYPKFLADNFEKISQAYEELKIPTEYFAQRVYLGAVDEYYPLVARWFYLGADFLQTVSSPDLKRMLLSCSELNIAQRQPVIADKVVESVKIPSQF